MTNFRCHDGPAGTRTITPHGELSSGPSFKLRRLLARALEDGCGHVIVDLSSVDYIDTGAIAMLVEAAGRAARAGAGLAVVSPPDSRAATIFRLSEADQVLPVLATREAALRAA